MIDQARLTQWLINYTQSGKVVKLSFSKMDKTFCVCTCLEVFFGFVTCFRSSGVDYIIREVFGFVKYLGKFWGLI